MLRSMRSRGHRLKNSGTIGALREIEHCHVPVVRGDHSRAREHAEDLVLRRNTRLLQYLSIAEVDPEEARRRLGSP